MLSFLERGFVLDTGFYRMNLVFIQGLNLKLQNPNLGAQTSQTLNSKPSYRSLYRTLVDPFQRNPKL